MAKAWKMELPVLREGLWIRTPSSLPWVHEPPSLNSYDLLTWSLGPRNRAPLGLKTTNAKAKGFQTPARPAADDALNKGNDKTQPRSASARRPKPRVSHAETTKVDPKEDEHALQEQEIEYMPPKPVGTSPTHSLSGAVDSC